MTILLPKNRGQQRCPNSRRLTTSSFAPSFSQTINPRPARRAFTLLELILALALTGLVVTLVGTAVNNSLRTIDSCRRRTEREQLARAVLHQIAGDLRAVVRYEPFDSSGLEASTGGSSAASSGGSSGQSGSGSGSAASSDDSSTSGSSSSSESSSTQTEETATLTAPIAGIYGDQSYVQIDISRIPRLDEYLYADGVNTQPPRGDIRTVTYSLAGSLGAVAPVASPTSSTGPIATTGSTGLVRSEIDRATSLWQSQGSAAGQSQNAIVLAPEVESLEFRYFDGTQWQTQWDSTVYGGVPRAVEISIYLQNDQHDSKHSTAMMYTGTGAKPIMDNPDNFYRLVVHLPAGLPLPAIPANMAGENTEDGSSSNSSDSSSGSSSRTNSGNQSQGGKQ